MFNTIKMSRKCPKCEEDVSNWQTKGLVIDGIYPVENFMGVFELNKRMSGEAYTSCHKCRTSLEVLIKNGKVIDDAEEIARIKKSAEELEEKAVGKI